MASDYFVDRTECSRHEIFPGVVIRTMAGRHLMLSFVEFDAGAEVLAHSHPHEQAGLILEGRLKFVIGDETKVMGPGEMYRIPGGVVHRAVAVDGPVKVLDVFHPVREDYL